MDRCGVDPGPVQDRRDAPGRAQAMRGALAGLVPGLGLKCGFHGRSEVLFDGIDADAHRTSGAGATGRRATSPPLRFIPYHLAPMPLARAVAALLGLTVLA